MQMFHRSAVRATRGALALAALATAASTPLRAQQDPFEGVITLETHSPRGGIATAQYMLKDDRVRVESAGRGGVPVVLLFDAGDRKMDILMAPQRMYVERTLSDSEVERAATRARAPRIEKTGRMETIAGRECEHWNVSDDAARYDVCVAKGLGTFFQAQNPFGAREMPAWYEELRGGAFPLRIARADGTTLMQVTSIERRPLDASLFTVPEGYRKMDMPGGLMRHLR